MSLCLASGSPRRRELLSRVGYAFSVSVPNVDETRLDESVEQYVTRVSLLKAKAVEEPGWVLAADTTVALGNVSLGKPEDATEAKAMLAQLAGREHRVVSGVALRRGAHTHQLCVETLVSMRPVATPEIDDYVAGGEWRGKAGGYAIQGQAAAFVREVRGSVTNVIGLPLSEVVTLLSEVAQLGPLYPEREAH